VHAVDDHGLCSDPSDTVSCVGEQSAPSVPAGLRALGGSSSVVLMWEDAPEPDVSGFVVYRDTAASFSYPDSVGFSEESGFTDVNVDLYRNYWYSVASRDYFGLESGLSETLAALPVAGDPVCVDIVNADPYQQDGTLAKPFDSIQEGIDHSSPGNAVLVFPGVYGESVTIDNDIDVMGLEGPEVTVIEGNVTVSGVGAARRFSGFAVDGLGNVQITLDVHDSDLLVDGCILRNASDACVSLNGDSESLLTHCEFIQGTYGVSVSDSSHPSIVVSRFEGNSIAHVFAEDEADANVGGSLLDASDLMSGPSLMVFNIGAGEVVAEYNWWGTLCPETDWFLGAVDYVPWTDDLHEQAYDECPSDVDEELPLVHALDQNYPNPFNPTTWISYDVPAPGGEVVLRVFAPSGRLVRTLADGYAPSGSYSVEWDGRDDRGVSVSSGVYLYQIQVGDFVDQKKMLLLK